MKERDIFIGSLFGLLAALSYTIMATLVKLSPEVRIEAMVFFRNVVSMIILLPFLLKKKISLKTKRFKLHTFRAIVGMLGLYAYFYAVRNLPLVNAILLANTSPLFIPLVVLLWIKSKIPKRRMFFLGLGFLGVALILEPNLHFPLVPSIIGLSAGLFVAVAMVSVRLLSKTEKTESILFYFFIFSIIISFFPMVFTWEPFGEKMWIYILGVGVAATFFQFFITKAYTYIPATQAGCLMYMSIVFGGIIGFFLFDAVPKITILLGACLVILGGVLTLLDKKGKIIPSKKG
ncbi:MAG: DMT family transporter [Chlamydiota bacterium]|jgi:drug/metabolite transporter (DMT)-like permease